MSKLTEERKRQMAYRSRVSYWAKKGVSAENMPLQTKGKYLDNNYIAEIKESPIKKAIEVRQIEAKPKKEVKSVTTEQIESLRKYLSGRFVSKKKIDLVFDLLKTLI